MFYHKTVIQTINSNEVSTCCYFLYLLFYLFIFYLDIIYFLFILILFYFPTVRHFDPG